MARDAYAEQEDPLQSFWSAHWIRMRLNELRRLSDVYTPQSTEQTRQKIMRVVNQEMSCIQAHKT
jgi:hypothetical protein